MRVDLFDYHLPPALIAQAGDLALDLALDRRR